MRLKCVIFVREHLYSKLMLFQILVSTYLFGASAIYRNVDTSHVISLKLVFAIQTCATKAL